MKKAIISLAVIVILLQAGCSSQSSIYQEKHYTSTTSSEDCFLCNADKHKSSWGKNNVGIISLNSFEIIPIEIIPDGLDGPNRERIAETIAETYVMSSSKTTSDGFRASRTIFSDRGHAFAEVYLYKDEAWDIEKTAEFLCEECLSQLTESVRGKEFGVGIVDLNAKEIHVFEEDFSGFLIGDFYIHWDLTEPNKYIDTRKLDLWVFYCPPICERNK